MRYMLLIGGDEAPAGFDAHEFCNSPEVRAWGDDLRSRGMWVGGDLLHPPKEATTVRIRDGALLVSDGPFAETKEQVGGYAILECANLDEAIDAAAGHPSAQFGLVEVRPIWQP